MKKTIIALLALSGVAAAATSSEMNTALDEMLTNYTAGDSYTLEINLTTTPTSGASNLITLTDDWNLRHQVGGYMAFWESGDPVWKTSDVTVSGSQTSLTLSAPANVWFSNTINNAGSATSDSYTLSGSSITISYDAATNATEISLTRKNGVTNILTVNNYEAKASDINFTTDMTGSVVSFSSTPAAAPSVPEPTTATLSLLALAGLAARRRRK